MSEVQEKLTLDKLVCKILDYKKKKPDHSASAVVQEGSGKVL